MRVLLVETGSANLGSVRAALARQGLHPAPVRAAKDLDGAELVVLPGVGSFGSAMERLRGDGLVDPLRRRVADGRPTLAICVGMQVLAAGSEESPGAGGLGIVAETVGRFEAGRRIPHMGWNRVDSGWAGNGHAYFANSYRLDAAAGERLAASGWEVAWTDHGGPFVAALRRGAVLACQFHPELSGEFGERVLAGWIGSAAGEVRSC